MKIEEKYQVLPVQQLKPYLYNIDYLKKVNGRPALRYIQAVKVLSGDVTLGKKVYVDECNGDKTSTNISEFSLVNVNRFSDERIDKYKVPSSDLEHLGLNSYKLVIEVAMTSYIYNDDGSVKDNVESLVYIGT